MIKLDEIDRDIIRQLQKDSRISVRRISKIINISEKTIRIRINKLMTQKIIKPICIVNPTAFGYVNFVDIFFKIDQDLDIKVLQEWLHNKGYVSYLSRHWHDQDFAIQCWFQSGKELINFISELENYPGILDVKYYLINEILWDSYSWKPEDKDYL
ncbi:Lrp/AsnC family transcriptional regulator [Spiroplasma endosymbiont of Stenodema calcarata]|uniref:Lrp/AsnC family transcriptional regulator n=1 Tax=Spiroplasma endosymbiont of Stenodema calcarata TaxID=3139328 RepID=UPI003CCB06C2